MHILRQIILNFSDPPFFSYKCIHFFRDNLIDHLCQENSRLRQEINRLTTEYQQIVADHRNRILELESTLSTKVSLQFNLDNFFLFRDLCF